MVDLWGATNAEDVDCFAINHSQHLTVLNSQGLPSLPVLQTSGYHVYHAFWDYRHIQV